MRHFTPLIAILLATAACQASDEAAGNSSVPADSRPGPSSAGSPPTPEAANAPAISPGERETSAPTPAPTDASVPPPPHMDPSGPTPPAESSALGAARRLQEYCDAIATGRFRDAFSYWGDNGKASGMSFEQFRDSFAKYRAYDCHIGEPGDLEGAAGSVYVTVPLRVTGALTSGGGFRLEGPITMRRVNDVDGSTAEQRRWHISQSGLKPRP